MAAKTEDLIALKRFRYGGCPLEVGDPFIATVKDAKLLIAVRKAARPDPATAQATVGAAAFEQAVVAVPAPVSAPTEAAPAAPVQSEAASPTGDAAVGAEIPGMAVEPIDAAGSAEAADEAPADEAPPAEAQSTPPAAPQAAVGATNPDTAPARVTRKYTRRQATGT